ncbi:MAG: 23S rRNA methyltransferase [Candidatus Tyloplasma litorale]|nr:MAG: 23S rRNA methyltransferase [Mycoplasmatales bacterium]
MKEIHSPQNKYIKKLAKLNTKNDILQKGIFLVEGKNLVYEAIKEGIVNNLLTTDLSVYEDEKNLHKTLVNPRVISKLSKNKTNRGIIAVCNYKPTPIELENFDKIIVLENINNPGNLGTIIRTALAFGFEAIVTLGDSVFAFNDKVIKASQGAVFKMPILQLHNFELLNQFTPYRFTLSSESHNIDKLEIKEKKFALVFGNEANGLTRELLSSWEGKDVKILINEKVESLNLAIAASIAINKFKNIK